MDKYLCKHYMKRIKNLGFLVAMMVMWASCTSPQKPPQADAAPTKSDTITTKIGTLPNPYVNLDASPLDIAYYPTDYPMQKMNGTAAASPVMRIVYGRPFKKNRLIFSDNANAMCPYGKPWRLGANEATEIEFFAPVKFAGKEIAPGRYILYAIPEKDYWTVVLNSNVFSWGLHIDPSKDIFRAKVPVEVQQPSIENFTISYEGEGKNVDLLMAWDDVKVRVPLVVLGGK